MEAETVQTLLLQIQAVPKIRLVVQIHRSQLTTVLAAHVRNPTQIVSVESKV